MIRNRSSIRPKCAYNVSFQHYISPVAVSKWAKLHSVTGSLIVPVVPRCEPGPIRSGAKITSEGGGEKNATLADCFFRVSAAACGCSLWMQQTQEDRRYGWRGKLDMLCWVLLSRLARPGSGGRRSRTGENQRCKLWVASTKTDH